MPMEIVYLIAGILAGSFFSYVVVFLSFKTKTIAKDDFEEIVSKLNVKENALTVSEERNHYLSEELSKKRSEESLRNIDHNSKLTLLETDLRDRNEIISGLREELAEYRAVNKSLNEKIETQKQEVIDFRRTSMNEFEIVANKILEEKTQKFTLSNKTSIENILKPLGDDLVKFKKQVEETYDKESKERHSLADRVRELIETSQKLGKEANDLTYALKGQSKKQGNWGEIILESILEKSGLEKGREYFVQETLKDEDGKNYRPDIIIKLPENRNIVIDSKISLVAYERYCSAEEKIDQDNFIKDHLRSIRNHVDQLSGKKYNEMTESLDFVMMFIPIEPAYMVALQNDNELWSYAYTRKVLLISPTNLVAALKLIADLWKRESQSRNAQKIADAGASLYDKFITFLKSVEDIGKHIRKTDEAYIDALNHLKHGRGNLIGRAIKLRDLGINTKKSIPDSMLSADQMDEEDELETALAVTAFPLNTDEGSGKI
jgi:DNA recombination protein RmuC